MTLSRHCMVTQLARLPSVDALLAFHTWLVLPAAGAASLTLLTQAHCRSAHNAASWVAVPGRAALHCAWFGQLEGTQRDHRDCLEGAQWTPGHQKSRNAALHDPRPPTPAAIVQPGLISSHRASPRPHNHIHAHTPWGALGQPVSTTQTQVGGSLPPARHNACLYPMRSGLGERLKTHAMGHQKPRHCCLPNSTHSPVQAQ